MFPRSSVRPLIVITPGGVDRTKMIEAVQLIANDETSNCAAVVNFARDQDWLNIWVVYLKVDC